MRRSAWIFAIAAVLCWAPGPAGKAQTASRSSAEVGLAQSKPALAFEANHGQTNSSVKFLARGRDYRLLLLSGEAVFVLNTAESDLAQTQSEIGRPERPLPVRSDAAPAVVRMRLVGADAEPEVTGLQRLPGRSHYIRPGQAQATSAERFARVRYSEAYPGIDLVFHGDQRRVEYDFVVAPGADPNRIKLAFEGVNGLSLDAGGDLLLDLPAGEIRQHKPVIYQTIAGARRIVEGSYRLAGAREIGFNIGEYDRSQPLVIDPILNASYLGGTGLDFIRGIATDADGNVYVTGETSSMDFPLMSPLQQQNAGGSADVFVTKLNPTLTEMIFSTYIGGSGTDRGIRIEVDDRGAAWVIAKTASSDFPTTPGAFQPASPGGSPMAVFRLTPSGDSFEYSTYLGGSSAESPGGLTLDPAGNAYVTGWTASDDFPVTNGALQPTRAGDTDVFVSKIAADGSLVYSTFLGGSSTDIGRAIELGSAGSVWITGVTASSDFPVSANATQSTFGGTNDAFLTQIDLPDSANAAQSALSSDGVVNQIPSGLGFSTFFGGVGHDEASGLVCSPDGQVAIAGHSDPTDLQGVGLGNTDGFVALWRPANGQMEWTTTFGGPERDWISTFEGRWGPGGEFESFTVAGSTRSGQSSTIDGLRNYLPLESPWVNRVCPFDTCQPTSGCFIPGSVEDATITPAGNDLFGIWVGGGGFRVTDGVVQEDFRGVFEGGIAEIPGPIAPLRPFGGAITLYQISYDYRTVSKMFSGTGSVRVNVQKLAEATGTPRGYLNAAIGDRWAIQNLYYDSFDDVHRLFADFALQDPQLVDNNDPTPGPKVDKVDVSIEVTPAPTIGPPLPDELVGIPVMTRFVNAEGLGEPVGAVPAVPAQQNFSADGDNFAYTQTRSDINVQAADGQCAPAAYANSLAWLESQYDQFDVPNDHVPGEDGDDSLAGQLDQTMGRFVLSRTDGEGVSRPGQLEGKFEYLANNGLADALVHKHQGAFAGDFEAHGIESKNEGDAVTFDWLCDQIMAGEDVEIAWSFFDAAGQSRGGHCVRVFGCGKSRGVPWIRYLHDAQQTSQADLNDQLGLETKQAWLGDLNGDGNLNVDSLRRELEAAVSESVPDEVKQQPGSPPFSLRDAVTNGASFIAERIAQGGISATFGFFEGLVTRNQLKAEAGIGAVSQAATTLPTTLGGLTVLINGTTAPLFFVSARQVNFQMPYEIEPGEATMVIRLNGKSSGFFSIPVGEVGPGIFLLNPSIAGPGRAVAQNQDFSLNVPGDGASPGEGIVVYVTGLGQMDNPVPTGQAAPASPLSRALAEVTAMIGGENAQVIFAGLSPGFVGLGQVNLAVPPLPPGDHQVAISAGGVASNQALVSVD